MPFYKGHKYNVGRECSPETREKLRITSSKPKVQKICLTCQIEFSVWPSVVEAGKGKYCSKACGFKGQLGKPTWNKGLLGFRAGKKRPGVIPKGEKNGCWKGESVGYSGLHQWIRKILGSADHCDECGLNQLPEGKRRYFDWANISHEYKRSLEDWKQLCKKCHKAFDGYGNRKVKQS